MINIMKKAREKHIKKYGVDPANPKIDIVNGVPLPREYVKELLQSRKLKSEESMETPRPNNQPAWDSNAIDYDIVNYESTVNYILDNYEAVYFAGHGNVNCIALGGDAQYCKDEVASNRDTRLFVIAACKAGNNLAPTLVNKGVQCVIGATETITDLYGLGECATWAALFWYRATGNIFAGSQRTAHEARIEANTITYLPSFMDCDLDAEKGNCNIYI